MPENETKTSLTDDKLTKLVKVLSENVLASLATIIAETISLVKINKVDYGFTMPSMLVGVIRSIQLISEPTFTSTFKHGNNLAFVIKSKEVIIYYKTIIIYQKHDAEDEGDNTPNKILWNDYADEYEGLCTKLDYMVRALPSYKNKGDVITRTELTSMLRIAEELCLLGYKDYRYSESSYSLNISKSGLLTVDIFGTVELKLLLQ